MNRQINANELSYFYQKTGEAIWHLQYVETFLVKLYFIKCIAKTPNGIGGLEAEVELKKLEKRTLGHLIDKLKKNGTESADFIGRLNQFNHKRKWVVHNSNRENGEMLYSDQGRSLFIDEICGFTDQAIKIQKEIEDILMTYTKSLGISEEEIIKDAKCKIDSLKGKS